MRDPAFLFYPDDYLGGTMGFSYAQHGAYLLALIFQFNKGHFSESQIRPIIGKHWNTIRVNFKQDGVGLWYNKRLDDEIAKRNTHSKLQSENAKARWNRTKKTTDTQCNGNAAALPSVGNAGAMPLGNGNGNGNGNGDSSSPEGEGSGEGETPQGWCDFKALYPASRPCGMDVFNAWLKITGQVGSPALLKRLRMFVEYWKKRLGEKYPYGPDAQYIPRPERWLLGADWMRDWEEEARHLNTGKQAALVAMLPD